MSDLYATRSSITIKVVELLIERGFNITQEKADKEWWVNLRSTGGYGLTMSGNSAFQNAGLQSWDIDIATGHLILPTLKLDLDHNFPCPYHIIVDRKGGKLKIYDSRVVVLIHLSGGLKKYLDNLKSNMSKK